MPPRRPPILSAPKPNPRPRRRRFQPIRPEYESWCRLDPGEIVDAVGLTPDGLRYCVTLRGVEPDITVFFEIDGGEIYGFAFDRCTIAPSSAGIPNVVQVGDGFETFVAVVPAGTVSLHAGFLGGVAVDVAPIPSATGRPWAYVAVNVPTTESLSSFVLDPPFSTDTNRCGSTRSAPTTSGT